jgi:diaminohydroxyphosphoribosylaminopyrimidine deaminase / 5-amino-6-(5-phosphoribosylamino)uracil reductase
VIEHERFMRRALELAERGLGSTSPNPAVGCVIVNNGGIVGEGWHEYAGGPHAEVNALKAAGQAAYGGSIYVTLEPCNILGKTPPCTKAIIEAGLNTVIVGAGDPNPAVNGRGVSELRGAGLKVETGVFAADAAKMNEAYNKHIVTGEPFVTMKVAMSADGRIATKTGSSRWITGEESRRLVHLMRSRSDAVLTGIGTIIADNPRLDARIEGAPVHQPTRIVIDAQGRIPADSLVVAGAGETATIVATTDAMSLEKSQSLADSGAEVMVVPKVNGRIDLKKLLRELGSRGICSILLEAGSALSSAFITGKIPDKYVFFMAPKLIGGDAALGFYGGNGISEMSEAAQLEFAEIEKVGEDIMIEAYPKK